MKTKYLNLFTILTLSIVLGSCKNKADEATTSETETVTAADAEAQKYTADVTKSTIEWKGSKPTGIHNGTINIEQGSFMIKDGAIQSGTFLIDMKSIEVLDMEGEYKEKLEKHLMGTVEGKEDHFFDVNKFPTATFEVTKLIFNSISSFTKESPKSSKIDLEP